MSEDADDDDGGGGGEEANGADATHPKSEKKRKELLHEKVRA